MHVGKKKAKRHNAKAFYLMQNMQMHFLQCMIYVLMSVHANNKYLYTNTVPKKGKRYKGIMKKGFPNCGKHHSRKETNEPRFKKRN